MHNNGSIELTSRVMLANDLVTVCQLSYCDTGHVQFCLNFIVHACDADIS